MISEWFSDSTVTITILEVQEDIETIRGEIREIVWDVSRNAGLEAVQIVPV